MLALLLLVMSGPQLTIDADAVGIYDAMKFVKTEGGYLLYSTAENVMATVDSEGQLTGRYVLAGEGPLEIRHPIFLNECGGEIWMSTHRNRILAFSQDLSKVREFGRIPEPFGQKIFLVGLPRSKQCSTDIWLVAGGASTHANILSAIEIEDKQWRTKQGYFPQDPEHLTSNFQDWLERSRISLHDGKVFHMPEAISADEDYYRVDVYPMPDQSGQNPDLLVSLAADVSDFSEFRLGKSVYMADAYKTEEGYRVIFQVRLPSQPQLVTLGDSFDTEGAFKVRKIIDKPFAACINGEEVLYFREIDGKEVWTSQPPIFKAF